MEKLRRISSTSESPAPVLIRLILAFVFLAAGTQKFLFPEEYGVGRFQEMGMPNPELISLIVGTFELGSGVLILFGLVTRIAAIPLIVIMVVAISTTKVPVLFEEGFWEAVHAVRLDYAMLLGAVFLMLVGAGAWSLDALLSRRLRGGP